MTTKKPFFQNTMKDITYISPVLESMIAQAIELGASPTNLNLSNAWLKCDKAIRSFKEIEQTATDLGYTSLLIALKALKQFKKQEAEVDITALPELFHLPSPIWLTGKPANKAKGEKGFAPLRVREAELQHKGILPWLLEAWALTDEYSDGEEVRDRLEVKYLNSTPEEFERFCYMLINDMEEPDLEVQLSNVLIERGASYYEKKKALDCVTEPNYGVGGTLEPPSWDD
jgi:hypothetical protein